MQYELKNTRPSNSYEKIEEKRYIGGINLDTNFRIIRIFG